MGAGRHRVTGGTRAAATFLVAAAGALLATAPLQVRGQADEAGRPPHTQSVGTATVAPAPPQSFGRPGDEARAFVPESAPHRLEAPSIGLLAEVTAYTPEHVAAHGGAVKPSTLWEVAWWTGGGTPGSHASNTVYLYGHTWKEPAVFNRVKELETGASVFLTTRSGRLEYVIERSFTVDKTRLDEDPSVKAARAGRLLLIGCYRATGHEDYTTQNVVVTAHLR